MLIERNIEPKPERFMLKRQHCERKITPNEIDCTTNNSVGELVEANGTLITKSSVEGDPQKAAIALCQRVEKGHQSMKKRKLDASRSRGAGCNEGRYVVDLSNGEIIQPVRVKAECFPKKSKHTDVTLQREDRIMKIDHAEEDTNQKIKWKRLITSILELNPDGVVKIRKLQKLFSKSLKDSGINLDEAQLRDRLKHKINSSSRFILLGNKFVRLAPKSRSWFPNVNKSNLWQKKTGSSRVNEA